jgi:hypothetical protein
MLTIIETPTFQKLVSAIWREDDLDAFKVWLAQQPMAGEVIPGSGGLRKVRWSRAIYSKSKFDNLPKDFLMTLKKEFEHGR